MIATEPARAKVNLCLHVTGRRADGYHLLDSLVVFADAADVVTARAADELTLTIGGPRAGALAAEPDNLVLRAARALAEAAGIAPRAALTLDKRLPVASGIGGGSADAAAALRALRRLWDLDVAADDLARIALRLGADVPACLGSRAVRMRGIGEILEPVAALPEMTVLLVNPGVAVSTPAVFGARAPGFSAPLTPPDAWRDLAALVAWLDRTANDLEPPARTLCPPIGAALAWLAAIPGCRLARMSGSGATCFGLFDAAAPPPPPPLPLPPGWWRSPLRGEADFSSELPKSAGR